MSTNGKNPDALAVLIRADQRWCQDRLDDPGDPDYLRHLANAVTPLAKASTAPAPATPAPDAGKLAELRADIAELTRQVGKLRADYDAVKADKDTASSEVERLQRELGDALRAVAEAAEERALAVQAADVERAHSHAWDWTDPTKPPLPCECGKPFPRLQLEEDTEPVVPDRDPWDEVWDRLRTDLAGWGATSKRRKRGG